MAKAACVGTVVVIGAVLSASTAQAHGAPWNPISRGAACAPGNERYGDSPACVAAQASSDAGALDEWDNSRRKGVNGQHQDEVPDGELCGAGLDAYRGLNLPRSDWPATIVKPSTDFTFSLLATVAHKGRFIVYITKNGYDPTVPLRWSDLESKPLVDVTDPPQSDSAYTFDIELPAGKKGRHVLFTIWEAGALAETSYYCSDVIFRTGAGASPPGRPSATVASPAPSRVPAVTRNASGGDEAALIQAPLTGSPQPSLEPVAQADDLADTYPGKVFMGLAGTIATGAASVVLVLSLVLMRKSRRRRS
ncbi:lytic polysaccharide monooxygenase [Streptomyces sp. NPDC057426]